MILPPLVVAVLAFLTGILAALRAAVSPLPSLFLATFLLVAAYTRLRTATGRDPRADLLLAAAFAAAGAALAGAADPAGDCRARIPAGARVQVEGLLGASVLPSEIAEGPPLLPLEQAAVVRGTQRCAGDVRVLLPQETPAALAGSHVVVSGTWQRSRTHGEPSPWPSPGFRAGYLRGDSVVAVSPPHPLRHPLLTLRGRSEAHLLALFPRHFALVEALLLGRRERLDPAVRERFSLAGLSHLLAISGSHVAILAGTLLVVGGALRQPRRRVAVATIALVVAYLALIGAPASALRAGAMLSLAMVARLLQRPSAVLPIAASACLLIVAFDPLAVLDVGMQLSFAGVFGIIAAQRLVGRRLASATRGTPWKWLADTLLVSAAAFIATAPIVALRFGTIAPVSILSNVPAVPLTALAQIGILAAVVASPLPVLSQLFAAGAGLTLDLLDLVARTAAAVPLGSAAVDRATLMACLVGAAGAGTMLLLTRRSRSTVRTTTAGGVAAALIIVWPLVAAGPGGALEIHFIDVGQGDAVAIRTPRNRWLLVDAGPRGREFDAGERRVVPFLRSRGVSTLEALILTHGDADHIGGAPAVIRHMRVRRVFEPGLALGRGLYVELLDAVGAEGAEWIAARAGRSLRIDGVELSFLWPDSAMLTDPPDDPNEASVVTLLRHDGFALILPGDASAAVEEALVRRHGDALRATVLKAGHHGSSTSTSAEFLQTVRPDLVVISAGRGNRYGHPAPDVLARLHRAEMEIARTDAQGTISLRVRPGERNPELIHTR